METKQRLIKSGRLSRTLVDLVDSIIWLFTGNTYFIGALIYAATVTERQA